MMDSSPEKTNLELLYEQVCEQGREFEVVFYPMLPRLYEMMVPSLEARLNFLSVGYRHVAFSRYVHGDVDCVHREVMAQKMVLLTSILSKLLNVNGILEHQEYLNTE